ncbi:MAG: TIGR04190 family B12-binding domain/radical SAM domain protein [Candidatus Hydrothermarchaeales archaeon]
MASADLILLHAPSVYDFRKHSIMYGPVSDLVPSEPIFEMYPVGFTAIAEYLKRHGYSVRIINLAALMLRDQRFNAEKKIESLDPSIFGIDLHWLVHAHGSIEIAKIVKKYHPDIPVVFGGFSATYFYKELIQYPEVDFVIRGDSAEEPMHQLIECVIAKRLPTSVPNLVWKNNGEVHENPFTYIPTDINDLVLDNTHIIGSVLKYRDLMGHLPFVDWLNYPIVPVFTCRGCIRNCVTCGGSATASKNFYNRDEPAFRDPEILVEDMRKIQKIIKGPIFVVGDIRHVGNDYVDRFFSAAKKSGITNQVIIEFFTPPHADFLKRLRDVFPHYIVEISIESHDEEVRKAFGRNYSNKALEDSIAHALKYNCERFDLYFMTGLPKQTPQSVLDSIEYCRYLYKKFNGDKRIMPFISPLAPFLDCGSMVFQEPEKYGYRLFYQTLEEHRQALLQPSWKYILNYETEWMTRDQIVKSTYQAALELNRLKVEYGVIDRKVAEQTEARILKAIEVMGKIDRIVALDLGGSELQEKMQKLRSELETASVSSIHDKREMKLPTNFLNFRISGFIALIFNKLCRRSL